MKCNCTRSEAVNLLSGILAGNGDVYGRMASSQPGGNPIYPLGLSAIVVLIKESLDPASSLYGDGRSILDEFLSVAVFSDD